MNKTARDAWAQAICNRDFICVETYSGYGGGTNADPQGKQNFLTPDASDYALGDAVLDALAHSRLILAAPRAGSTYPPDIVFDPDFSDYKQIGERYAARTRVLMEHYGYKTRRALFKDMKNCYVKREGGTVTICPSHHEKLEAWGRTKGDGIEDVVLPADSPPGEIGAALRTAFSRCT
jgi:hypothetical protein